MDPEALSVGEEAFANSFTFKPFVPEAERQELRDFLYKYAFNYQEAQEYLQLLKQVNDIEYDKSQLMYRIHGMSLQCFALAMRRLTDKIGERSGQKLLAKLINDKFKNEEMKRIQDVNSHYAFYLNKGVAHQDKPSIRQHLLAFPDTDVIEADMKHLQELYSKIVREICESYINIAAEGSDYTSELSRLADT